LEIEYTGAQVLATITNARITDYNTFNISKGDGDDGSARLVAAPAILPPLFFGRAYRFAVRREAATAFVANELSEMVLERESSDPRLLVGGDKDDEKKKESRNAKHVCIRIPVAPSDVTMRSNNALHYLWAESRIADLEASDRDHTRLLKINHDADVVSGRSSSSRRRRSCVCARGEPYPNASWVCNGCRTTYAADLKATCFHCTTLDRKPQLVWPVLVRGRERTEAIRVSLEHGVLSRFTDRRLDSKRVARR
jgi:hypothetical protein